MTLLHLHQNAGDYFLLKVRFKLTSTTTVSCYLCFENCIRRLMFFKNEPNKFRSLWLNNEVHLYINKVNGIL